MTTPAPASKPAQVRSDELYDSDDALPKDSPLLKPIRLKLDPSPTPPPEQPLTVSSPPSPGSGKKKSNRRMKKNKVTQADVVLLRTLGGPEHVARDAFRQTLPSESEESSAGSDSDYSVGGDSSLESHPTETIKAEDGPGKPRLGDIETKRAPSEDPGGDMGAFDLKSLAAGALAFASPGAPPEVDAGPTPPVTEHDVVKERPHPIPVPSAITIKRTEYPQDPRHHAALSPYSPPSIPPSLYSPREPSAPISSHRSPPGLPSGLPPIQVNQVNSPGSDISLPSIKALGVVGDLDQFVNDHQKEKERLRSQNSFPVSPPAAIPRFPPMQHGHHTSPPISPAETFRREPLSPSQSIASATSPGFHYTQPNGHYRPPEYASPKTDTPGSDQQGTTPATIADRMSIDGLTNQATYVCTFAGCTASPFQTQYLLNSHMNVHSSARPHYCPVPGCPRSEGGKGFKRKNEMIRHGLVHESPGYVCPFCPDREHKYPRPDNLQRHVRVHHVDKDKDDPALRDVLAQRPDGPNRGRRRRGGPN
ncbi:metallothionein expression activator [Naviculisporaceae sp. PSN 640]